MVKIKIILTKANVVKLVTISLHDINTKKTNMYLKNNLLAYLFISTMVNLKLLIQLNIAFDDYLSSTLIRLGFFEYGNGRFSIVAARALGNLPSRSLG